LGKRRTRYIVVTIVLIAILSAVYVHLAKTTLILQQHFAAHPRRTVFVLVSLLLAVIFSSFTLYKYSPGVLTFSKTLQGSIMLAPLLALLSLAYFSIYVVAPDGLEIKWLSSAGSVFVVVMAVITAGGFLFTVARLEEIHGRILSYPHLLERLDALLELEFARVTRKGKRNSGRLYILANAPAIGNVSAPEEFDLCWQRLEALLKSPDVEVKIACLSWEQDFQETSPIHRFYFEHWANTVGNDELRRKINQSLEMISIVRKSKPDYLPTRPKELYRLKNTIHEVPFHLVLTTERAILFTALSFPDYSSESLNDDYGIRQDDHREVKVVGFETGDRSILDALRKGFDRRLHKIAIRDGGHQSAVTPILGQADEPPVEIPVNNNRTIRGSIRREANRNRWILICGGLTGNLQRASPLDDLAEVLHRSGWSSLRFDYGNSLAPRANQELRTMETMLEDVSACVNFMSRDQSIGKPPDIVVARGFGCRVALEALPNHSNIPLVMWAPILWLATSLEMRGRLHELRRSGRLEFDSTEIGIEFVRSLSDPTDEQIKSWIKPERQHVIVQGEDDEVAPLRFALEAKKLILEAGGQVHLKTVLGSHPHPATDVEVQLKTIKKVLDQYI
jgi:hypothetical protein